MTFILLASRVLHCTVPSLTPPLLICEQKASGSLGCKLRSVGLPPEFTL